MHGAQLGSPVCIVLFSSCGSPRRLVLLFQFTIKETGSERVRDFLEVTEVVAHCPAGL